MFFFFFFLVSSIIFGRFDFDVCSDCRLCLGDTRKRAVLELDVKLRRDFVSRNVPTRLGTCLHLRII